MVASVFSVETLLEPQSSSRLFRGVALRPSLWLMTVGADMLFSFSFSFFFLLNFSPFPFPPFSFASGTHISWILCSPHDAGALAKAIQVATTTRLSLMRASVCVVAYDVPDPWQILWQSPASGLWVG
jgi:hypothetical protein